MSKSTINPEHSAEFTTEQKEYLAGFLEGIARRGLPYVGATANGQFTSEPAHGGANLAAPKEENIFGTPLADVTKQERWKHEEHPLDGWDRILEHAEAAKFTDEENTYRFRNFGLFYV